MTKFMKRRTKTVRLDPKFVEFSFFTSKILNRALKSVLLTGDGDFLLPQTHLMQKGMESKHRSMKTKILHVKP